MRNDRFCAGVSDNCCTATFDIVAVPMNRRNFLGAVTAIPFVPERHFVPIDELDDDIKLPVAKPKKVAKPRECNVPNGIKVATQCFISVNGVDISDHICRAELKTTQDYYSMDTYGRTIQCIPTLKEQTLEIEVLEDFTGITDDAEWQRLGGTSEIRFRPYNERISAKNPESMFQAYLVSLVSVERGNIHGVHLNTRAVFEVISDVGGFSFWNNS